MCRASSSVFNPGASASHSGWLKYECRAPGGDDQEIEGDHQPVRVDGPMHGVDSSDVRHQHRRVALTPEEEPRRHRDVGW